GDARPRAPLPVRPRRGRPARTRTARGRPDGHAAPAAVGRDGARGLRPRAAHAAEVDLLLPQRSLRAGPLPVRRRVTRILLSAGEVSGEHHAARLLAAVRRRDPSIAFDAFGGRHLEAAGARLLFPLSDFAVMGFKAVLDHLGTFVKVLARFDR